jgi:ADP-ribose pyrophosphatase
MAEERWEVLSSEQILEHPFLTVEMERVRLPDGRVIEDWPIVHTRDYVNVVVLNDAGQAMILEGYKHGLGRSSWQVPGGYLKRGEEPLAAAQRELMEEIGYESDDWRSLGSFVIDANRGVGVGHFFLATGAMQVAASTHDDLEGFEVKWVDLAEVKQALMDGRVGIISYAANLALALLTLSTE